MIDMLLDFSKMSTADRPNATELAPVVEEVVDAFREKAAAHGVSIEVAVEEGLCVAAEPIVVASPLQNLIENAFKYGRCPDKAPVIDVRAFSRAGMAIVEVEDRGPGITPAEAETLFRAFARGRDGGEGVGLGLATAKRLVEARGGSLGLRVGQYGGALFQIRLPAAYAADHGERREALSGPQV
jgi:signal transduction histidine kinase